MGIERAYLDVGRLDRMGYGNSLMHRFDPRAKLIVAVTVIAAVLSFPKYEIADILPFMLFPVGALTLGDVPLRFLAVRLLAVSPFALGVGIFNPVFDRTPVVIVDNLSLAAGWISFASIMLRFAMSVSMGVLLVATTSMPGVGEAMIRLRFPRIFVVQILLLYRYLFVLIEEGMRLVRARNARGGAGKSRGLHVYSSMLASLFLRTSDRAGRIHRAMLARGFNGEMRRLGELRFQFRDAVLVCGAVFLVVVLRTVPLVDLIGSLMIENGGRP